MNKKTEKETRLINVSDLKIETRADDEAENDKMIIEGYAAVFDKRTLIGTLDWGFYEIIDKKAFDGSNMKDVPLKYNHSDEVPILARTRNKSLTLSVDDKGLFMRAELLDTQDSKDMYKRIKAGLIDKMSFAFTVASEEFSGEDEQTPTRKITKIDRLFDVSVVDMPAYDDTSVYARSLSHLEEWRKPPEGEKRNKNRDYSITNLIYQYGGKF